MIFAEKILMDFCSMFCCVKKGSDRKSHVKKESTWRIFSLKELQLATNNFNYDNKLGEGGFGSVYWGQLWDGSQIAVKRLKSWSDKVEMDFSVEVQILARLRHKNLLTLRGYCAEGQERLIVYDYMTNLSLLSHLHGQYSAESHLDWTKRMNIAIGAAEGIAYLHHYATPQTIHQGIKASNILLDIDFKPQVADFGFAKLVPEYGPMSEKASERCDIYSFGILLLELVSGKKPLEKLDSTTTKRSIVEWALPLARERKFDEIADKRLNGKYVEEEVKRVVFVGLICARDRSEKRPTILEVVEMLRGDEEKFGGLESDEMFEKKSVVVVDCGAEERAEFVISDEKGTKQEIEFV